MSLIWDLSSAGRASALQAEGHRFEPYRPHTVCRSGGTGRRPGLKIPWVVIPVPVRFRSAALVKRLILRIDKSFFIFDEGASLQIIPPAFARSVRDNSP